MSRGPGHAISLSAAQLRAEALRLRTAGYLQTEIAAKLGVTQPTVSRAIARALREHVAIGVQELRATQSATLDKLKQHMLPLVEREGDTSAAHVVLGVEARRAKLMGLDLERSDLAGPSGQHVTVLLLVDGRNVATPDSLDAIEHAAVQEVHTLPGVRPDAEVLLLSYPPLPLQPGRDVLQETVDAVQSGDLTATDNDVADEDDDDDESEDEGV